MKLTAHLHLVMWVYTSTQPRRARRSPPDMKDCCEYIEQEAMESQQGVVLQLLCWVRG